MALITDPVARAKKATTKLQAARLHLELESELGLNDNLPDGWEAQAEEALRYLGDQWGGEDELRDHDTTGPGGNGWAPSLSKGANKSLAPKDPTPDAPAAAPKRPAQLQRARRAGQARRGGGGVSPRTRRAFRQTGIPGAGASTSQIVLQVLGFTIGLSALYLILDNTQNSRRGGSAVEQLFSGLQTALALIVDPVDPLQSGARAQAQSAQAVQAAKTSPAAAALIPGVGAAVAGAQRTRGTTKSKSRPIGARP